MGSSTSGRTARIVTILASFSLVGSTLLGGAATADSPLSRPAPAVLRAGHSLVHHSAQMTLRNGEFVLVVEQGGLEIYQDLTLTGSRGDESVLTTAWKLLPPHPKGTDSTRLVMRRNGNLVLTTQTGKTLWSTHTAGTGTDNRLVLSARGNLAVLTSKNKVVWSSRSGAEFLAAGDGLASGQKISQAIPTNEKGVARQTLTMERGGNLVRRCGAYVLWQSRTHVAGSRMVLRDDGNLMVLTPSGRTVWSSHSGGHSSYVFLDIAHMSVNQVIPRSKILWTAFWKHQC